MTRKGQQIMECLLLFVVVVVILLAFARPHGPFHHALDSALNQTFNVMAQQNPSP